MSMGDIVFFSSDKNKRPLSHPCIDEIRALDGVKSLCLLPDMHIKDKYLKAGYKCSVPSSCVIVSDRSHYYPQLRSRGIGCGMMVCKTGMEYGNGAEDVFAAYLERLISRSLADDIALGADAIGRKLLKRRTTMLPGVSYGVAGDDWWHTVRGGALAYVQRHASASNDIVRFVRNVFESAGCHGEPDAEVEQGHFDPLWVNGSKLGLDDIRIGRMFGGNHFLEAQRVAEVYDTAAAQMFDIHKNEVMLHAHSCGGMLENCLNDDIIGRHVKRPEYRAIGDDDPLSASFFHAVSLLKNMGSIQRAALCLRLKDTASASTTTAHIQIRPILECTHNDVTVEETEGGRNIVYRHNVHRLYDDRLTVVSGRWDHPSYLAMAGPNAHLTSYSVDHGVGVHIERCEGERAVSGGFVRRIKLYGRVFRIKRKSGSALRDAVGEEMLNGLVAKGVIRMVARLDPIVNLKMIY